MNKLDRLEPSVLRANPRCTLAAWKKYEPIISAAFMAHPKPYVYRPTNMAPSTVCTRVRDAVRGALALSHPSDIAPTDLARWYSEVIFKHDEEYVYIGIPQEVTSVVQGNSVVPSVSASYAYSTLTFEEISAFTLLLSGARINGPVIIAVPPDLSLLPARPNVEMLARPDGSLVIL